jgi:phosphoglucomutase
MKDSRAGSLPRAEDLVDVEKLIAAFYEREVDAADPDQKVEFGTSGHRGSSFANSFNEAHILALTQAVVDYRRDQGIAGPLFLGKDSHALSGPAMRSAVEVLAANEVEFYLDSRDSFVPTPALSHAVLQFNHASQLKNSGSAFRATGEVADGIVLTPSHNPPTDGGFKYNPPHGGPADAAVTGWIQNRANRILEEGLAEVRRVTSDKALASDYCKKYDYRENYVADLKNVIDFEPIARSGIRVATDTLGGAALDYWPEIIDRYGLDWEVIHPTADPTFSYITLDWDEKIRMDCSSPNAMNGLTEFFRANPQFDLATGNDGDADRHGIVDSSGLLNPNHFLAVAIDYLFRNRENWGATPGIGKTLVSSSLIDRVAKSLNRRLVEVPVGFKWFVDGLLNSSLGFGGEESAGASFLRLDSRVWTTDKDGPIMCLLAAEIYAKTELSPSGYHAQLINQFGQSWYNRVDNPATRDQKIRLAKLSASAVSASQLAGDPITAILTEAPGNSQPLGGLKVATDFSWFAARPSGTENLYKIYAESFRSPEHLSEVIEAAKTLVSETLGNV